MRKTNLEFSNLVIVEDAECINDGVFQQVFARRTFSAILVGGTASNQENAPHTSGSRSDFQCFHQLHFSQRIVANMVHIAKAVPIFTFYEHFSSELAIVFDQLCELEGGPLATGRVSIWH